MREHILAQHLFDRRVGAQYTPPPETTTYLNPTAPVSGLIRGDTWVPPFETIASRRPPLKSRGFCRGFVVDPTSNRALVYESNLERGFAYICLADPKVLHVHDQPPHVLFQTRDGMMHKHTFDFLVTLKSGKRVAFAVKPTARVERSGINEILSLIRMQSLKGFAESAKLVTEQQITSDRVHNAELVLRARRSRNEDDIQVLLRLVSTLNGAARLEDLVASSGLGGHGFNALICLIGDGIVEPVSKGRLSDQTMVRPHPDIAF